MSQNAQIESTILDALKAEFINFDVVSFPLSFETFSFTSPIGCFLIKFVKSVYYEQNTLWEVNQNGESIFEIISCYRGLKSYGDIHSPQQKLKDAIQGLEILGRKIILVKEEFLKESNTDIYCKLTCKINIYNP